MGPLVACVVWGVLCWAMAPPEDRHALRAWLRRALARVGDDAGLDDE